MTQSEHGVPQTAGTFEEYLANQEQKRTHSFTKDEEDGETEYTTTYDPEHSFSNAYEGRMYARAKAVDRYYTHKTRDFSTIHIALCADKQPDESIANHTKRIHPSSVQRKWRTPLKQMDRWEEASVLVIKAPKKDTVPQADRTSCIAHVHICIWIPGKVLLRKEDSKPEDRFQPVVDKHIEKVKGAREAQHGDGTITVQHHISDEVETPEYVHERGNGLDEKRGDTTALPHEAGKNMSLLKCQYDAREAPRHIREWHAGLWQSKAEPTTQRFKELGQFKQVADRMDTYRFQAVQSATKEYKENPQASKPKRTCYNRQQVDKKFEELPESNRKFIMKYLQEGPNDHSRSKIRNEIRRNLTSFTDPIHAEEIVKQCRLRITC